MPAETLHCPDCGASVPSDATRCAFCGATLATVTCPSCFGTMFAGAKFCSHCGAQGNRSEAADGETQLCPRCQATMKKVTVGTTSLAKTSGWKQAPTNDQDGVAVVLEAALKKLPAVAAGIPSHAVGTSS